MNKHMTSARALLCLLLVGCTLLLCACPANGTCTHSYENGVCTLCGAQEPATPCAHTYANGICTKCGAAQNCTHTFENGECTQCGAADPDYEVIYGEGAVIEGAGDALASDAAVLTPVTYDESKAVSSPGAIFFRSFKADGKVYRLTGDKPAPINESGKTFGGKNTVLLLTSGMKIDGVSDVTLRDMVIVGDVAILASSGISFENVQILGNVTVDAAATDILFSACRIEGGITNAGTNLGVQNCYVKFTETGLADNGKNTILISSRFEGSGTAIKTAAVGASYTYNTLTVNAEGVGVAMETGVTNSVAGMNIIRGAQTSATIHGGYNVSFVRNSVISIIATGNHAVYVIDNAMGGRVKATENNYLLADGNTFPDDGKSHAALQSGNQNVNGDTLMDVDARLEVGADERLLPHIDKDLFVGMELQTAYRLPTGEEKMLYNAILAEATKKDVVIVTPGKYMVNDTARFGEVQNNTVVYAHGVYAEGVANWVGNAKNNHLRIEGATDITLKGITLGYAQQSCGQVFVLKKEGANNLRVVTGAGMWDGFAAANSTYVYGNGSVGIQKAGSFHAIGDFTIEKDALSKNKDGTMRLTVSDEIYDLIEPGDIMTSRFENGATTVQTKSSTDITYMDMTVYGYAGSFAMYEHSNLTSTTYYRVFNTTRSGEIIDEETYEKYAALEEKYGVSLEISVDEKERFRGSPAHIGSLDATHTIDCVEGSTVISCIFENMGDDGTNQHSYHARLAGVVDNGDGTSTVTYKANLTINNYNTTADKSKLSITRRCQDFRVGDRVYIYTSAGQLVCDTTALSATVSKGSLPANHRNPLIAGKDVPHFSITVKTADINFAALEGFDFADDNHESDEKVLVDNMTLASNTFLFDNMVVRNVRSRGLLIKASDGAVRNCTFQNIAKVAVALLYEIQWGESGISENVTIEKCLFDHNSFAPGGGISNGIGYMHAPINIIGMGGQEIDEDYLLQKNIKILNNSFINRDISNTTYAIYIQAARDILIEGNDFGYSEEDTDRRYATAVYLQGAMNIELNNNIYPPFILDDYTQYVQGDVYKNIYGTDVSDINGDSFFEDKL